jgi:hypothetical protein
MFVRGDSATRPVLRGIEPCLLCGADGAIVQIARFHLVDVLLLALQTARFLRGELSRLQALLDALLLIHVALLVLLDRLRESSGAHDAGDEDTEINGSGFHSRIFRCR